MAEVMAQPKRYPCLFIQSDWNESIRVPKTNVWITAKYLNEPSVHGQIKSISADDKPKLISSEEFSIQSHTSNSIVVKYCRSDVVTAFVAPMKAFKVHKKAVLSVAAAENALVLSSSEDDKILVWDSRTGEEMLSLVGHGGPAYKCKFFPSGIVALTAGADGSLRIWSAENGTCPVTLSGHTMAVTDVAVIDRGRNIISASKDGKVKLWDVGEAKCLSDVMAANGNINCCCLVTTTNVKPVDNHREVSTGDKLVVAGCENGSVFCAHVGMREVLFVIHLDSPVNCCADFDFNFLVGCENGKVLHISAIDGSIINEWWESGSPILSLASLPNSRFVVGRQDGTCTMYSSLDQHTHIRVQLTGSDLDPIRDISFNGRWIFTGCRDFVIRKYDCNQLNVHFK